MPKRIQLPAALNREPRYRFHGSTPPDRKRPRAQLVPGAPTDGVATLRIYDVIDSWGGLWGISAAEVADALDGFDDDVEEIQLRINSPGGEIFEGVAIMNLLAQHPARIVAHVDGLAASAASFLACSADETVMHRSTQLMIHDGWGLCIGNAADMRTTGDLLDRLSNSIAEVYQSKAGGTLDTWRGAMLAESWYSAQEAVDAGLADRLAAAAVEDEETEDEAAAARYNLKDLGARYANRDEAPAPGAPAPSPAPAPVPAPQAAPTPDLTARAQKLRERRLAARIGSGN